MDGPAKTKKKARHVRALSWFMAGLEQPSPIGWNYGIPAVMQPLPWIPAVAYHAGVRLPMAASLNTRVTFAARVYGCGFIDPIALNSRTTSKKQPVNAIVGSIPLSSNGHHSFSLTIGTNDAAFDLHFVVLSADVIAANSRFCISVRMPRSHG